MSGNAQNEQCATIKERANREFRARNFRDAIALYTEALSAASVSTPLELKRTILSNRSQAYLLYGNIHTALRDVDLALSSEYTLPDSPTDVTAKSLYRRARLLFKFARYNEAQRDIDEFKRLRSEKGEQLTAEELSWKNEIADGLAAPEGSRRQCKDELMRAVDSRGIMLLDNFRSNFPYPLNGNQDFDSEEGCVSFNTPDGRVDRNLADPNLTPISIPLYITAPFFQIKPEQDRRPYRANMNVATPENATIGSVFGNIFASGAVHGIEGGSHQLRTQIMMSALEHDSADDSTIMLTTSRGRWLVIPRSTTLAEIFAGARWPRDGPLGFRDMRRKPRSSNFEQDGVELSMGCFIELYVIPNNRLTEHIHRLEQGLEALEALNLNIAT